jgi:hypothetical protein
VTGITLWSIHPFSRGEIGDPPPRFGLGDVIS